MKKLCLYNLWLLMALWVCFASDAVAIVLNGPTSAFIGDNVGFTANITVSPVVTPGVLPNAVVSFDFGDQTQPQPVNANLPIGGGSAQLSVTHRFNSVGTFTVTASGTVDPDYVFTGPGPNPDTTQITILPPPISPPPGTVGERYSSNLSGSSGGGGNRYTVIGGTVPPGLNVAGNGDVTGIPLKKGTFTFGVRINTVGGQVLTTNVSIAINPGELRISAAPFNLIVTKNAPSHQKVTFTVVYPQISLQETASSSRGIFYVNNRAVGYNNTALSIDLASSNRTASETISIPNNVFAAAQQRPGSTVTYGRIFSSPNLNNGTGELTVDVRSPASGDLRITKMRVYFEQNNRPIILVERNEKDLTGVVDIHYNGTGTFKGHWRVGERILKRIQKNIYYGKVMTLKTPDVPHLPTYSEGSHRLQFIITEPESAQDRIDFPEAIYHVEAKRAEIVKPITLISPDPREVLGKNGGKFSWTNSLDVSTYQLEFMQKDQGESFFKVFTKKPEYALSETLIKLKFTMGDEYSWRVKGYSKDGELVAQSSERQMHFSAKLTYVPGEILFVVNKNKDGLALIPRILSRYDLQLIEQRELISIGRIVVLCRTSEDVFELSARLQSERGLLGSQPNFIFSTMGEMDPLRSLQSIDKLMNLDDLHKNSTGQNIKVAVIDTGVDYKHEDLNDRMAGYENFIKDSPYKAEIHGTAVAGVIAASHNSFGILGVAPDTSLYALRACKQLSAIKSEGECYSLSVARAIDAAIVKDVDIVNLSFGMSGTDDIISSLIDKGHQSGVLFTAAVGNNGQAESIHFPASHPGVISVAGFGDDSKPFPNRRLAERADAIGPAKNIFSAAPGGKHNFFDGTSFATAAITGILSLSLEKNREVLSEKLPCFEEPKSWQEQVRNYMNSNQQ